MRRRTFFKVLPAVGLAASASPVLQEPKKQETPTRVKKESLHAAEQLIGIELTDAQETMALPGVDRALTGYENLRKIEVPLDTEPAIAFHPALPGKKFPTGPPTGKVFRRWTTRQPNARGSSPLSMDWRRRMPPTRDGGASSPTSIGTSSRRFTGRSRSSTGPERTRCR